MEKSFWTEKRVKKLKELLSKGLPTSEIGKKLGVSKNTVIGKIHRLRRANELDANSTGVANSKTNKTNKAYKKGLFSFSLSGKKEKTQDKKSNTIDIEKSSETLIKDKIIIESKIEVVKDNAIGADENDSVVNDFLQDERSFFKDKNKNKKYQLRDLKNDMCRWAYGEPNSTNFFFCGKKTVANKPYCLKHAKMAYIIKKNDE